MVELAIHDDRFVSLMYLLELQFDRVEHGNSIRYTAYKQISTF